MGWGMLHRSAGAGLGQYPDHLTATAHLQEPHLMLHQDPSCSSSSHQQLSYHHPQEDLFADRSEEDLLASLLQVSGQLEDVGCPSPQDTDLSSSCDGVVLLGSPQDSCRSPPPPRVNSVAATRTHLIKEGLKLTIQSRRRERGQIDLANAEYDEPVVQGEAGQSDDLTEEDAERRRRRRERNKMAATKCRNKKKERTQRLAVESTCLESNNQFLKEEIRRLEVERQELLDILQSHRPTCPMRSRSAQAPHHMQYMEGH